MVDFSAPMRAVRGIIPLVGIVVIVATGSYTPQVTSAKSSNPTYSEGRGVDAREFAFAAPAATKPEGAPDSLAQRVDSIFASFASTNRPGGDRKSTRLNS